jgi:LacI family transcriptional regulator
MPNKTDIPRRRRAATLSDVGREAGVSAMAASAVLNGARTSTRISEETRARVLAAAQKLRYRPNATARGLADQRMNTLGVVATLAGDEPNLYFLEVFNGIIVGAAAHGQTTTVFTIVDWDAAAQRISNFCDGRVDGLILLAPMLAGDAAEWLPEHTPMVSVHANHEMAGVPNLESDEENGAYLAVRQMLEMGHRRILHVGGPTDAIGADRRVRGYRRAHAEAGLVPAPDLVIRGGFSVDGGRDAFDAWMRQHAGKPLPDAIFAASDAIALGCLDRLLVRGLRVPADISVVGFDDTVLARAARLSTVAQPLGQLGRQAVDVLVGLIEARHERAPAHAATSIVLPTVVVPGATLSAPRTTQITID